MSVYCVKESERDSEKKWSRVVEIRYRGGIYKGRSQGGLPEGKVIVCIIWEASISQLFDSSKRRMTSLLHLSGTPIVWWWKHLWRYMALWEEIRSWNILLQQRGCFPGFMEGWCHAWKGTYLLAFAFLIGSSSITVTPCNLPFWNLQIVRGEFLLDKYPRNMPRAFFKILLAVVPNWK